MATTPALRANGLQVTSLASTPVIATKQGVWVDNAGTPNLRFEDGTNTNYVLYAVSSTGIASGGGNLYGFLFGSGSTTRSISSTQAATDTAGATTTISGQQSGPVSGAGGKTPGQLQLVGASGVAGTAGLAAGAGQTVLIQAGAQGTNNGGGSAVNGSIILNIAGATGTGTIAFQANGSTTCSVDNIPNFIPATTGTGNIGTASRNWLSVWAGRYSRTQQTIAAAASVTVNPANGNSVRITLSATAITSLTVSAGNSGEVLHVEVIQDGTGGRSIPTTWTNVKFAGGTYTATSTANKRDVISLVYDASDSAWCEVCRAMNQ